ncbi:MAG: uroporphyrinogen-III synthase [Rickettsiales bacterium]
MKNILITKSKNRSQDLAEFLSKNNYQIFFQSLFSIKKIIPKNLYLPSTSLQKPLTIILSSANSIYSLEKLMINKNSHIYVVGNQTAKKLNKLGYFNVYFPKIMSGKSLFDLIKNQVKPCEIYYFHGEKISFDFKNQLQKEGFTIKSFVVYKTTEIKSFSKKFIDNIKEYNIDEVLIFSINSLEIFEKLIKKNNLLEYFNSKNIICLSSKIAENAQKIGFKNISIFADNKILKKFYESK